jgi:hypothetical protein
LIYYFKLGKERANTYTIINFLIHDKGSFWFATKYWNAAISAVQLKSKKHSLVCEKYTKNMMTGMRIDKKSIQKTWQEWELMMFTLIFLLLVTLPSRIPGSASLLRTFKEFFGLADSFLNRGRSSELNSSMSKYLCPSASSNRDEVVFHSSWCWDWHLWNSVSQD